MIEPQPPEVSPRTLRFSYAQRSLTSTKPDLHFSMKLTACRRWTWIKSFGSSQSFELLQIANGLDSRMAIDKIVQSGGDRREADSRARTESARWQRSSHPPAGVRGHSLALANARRIHTKS